MLRLLRSNPKTRNLGFTTTAAGCVLAQPNCGRVTVWRAQRDGVFLGNDVVTSFTSRSRLAGYAIAQYDLNSKRDAVELSAESWQKVVKSSPSSEGITAARTGLSSGRLKRTLIGWKAESWQIRIAWRANLTQPVAEAWSSTSPWAGWGWPPPEKVVAGRLRQTPPRVGFRVPVCDLGPGLKLKKVQIWFWVFEPGIKSAVISLLNKVPRPSESLVLSLYELQSMGTYV